MAKKITPYYQLPPRQEYIDKVLNALSAKCLSVGNIVIITKLTKTQVTCALDNLTRRNIVQEKIVDKKKIYIKIE